MGLTVVMVMVMVIINYHLWWTIESLYALNVVLVQLKVWSGDGIKVSSGFSLHVTKSSRIRKEYEYLANHCLFACELSAKTLNCVICCNL